MLTWRASPRGTSRERGIQESLRQMVSRLVAGFHLRIPDHAQRSGEWVEYKSALMQIPSLTSSRGTAMVKHVVSRRDQMQIVQTVGKGAATINLPIQYLDAPEGSHPQGLVTGGGGGGAANDAEQFAQFTWTNESDVEATWEMRATGVAIFERQTGIMSERVWLVNGQPTASAGQGTQLPPFRNAGRITMLGKTDRPDVGKSTQVSPPGVKIDGLDAWVSIETFPE